MLMQKRFRFHRSKFRTKKFMAMFVKPDGEIIAQGMSNNFLTSINEAVDKVYKLSLRRRKGCFLITTGI